MIAMAADHAVEDDGFFDGDIFVYRGGRAPQHVAITHVLIDISVSKIEDDAFHGCERLLTVETHDGLRKVGKYAFCGCKSLRQINLKSAVEIERWALEGCVNLESVEFGDRLETIREAALSVCNSLIRLKLPSSVITIERSVFYWCERLTDVELSERLQTIGACAFYYCERRKRIAIPLRRGLFLCDEDEEYNQFGYCDQLTTVDLVGGTHRTVALLHMESWRTDMIAEINRINQVLPNTHADEKTNEIRQWMHSVLDKMDHYKAEHCRYVKEGITLLELALWKAKLGEKAEYAVEMSSKKAKVDIESARKRKRVTCGADMVIKNVLPFLQLE